MLLNHPVQNKLLPTKQTLYKSVDRGRKYTISSLLLYQIFHNRICHWQYELSVKTGTYYVLYGYEERTIGLDLYVFLLYQHLGAGGIL